VIDSSGFKSLPSNVARGNFVTVGNFRQCLNVKAVVDASAEGYPNGTITVGGQNIPAVGTSFNGQYCWAYIG
jgi:hypothetical protein